MGDRPFIMQIYNGKRWIFYSVNFVQIFMMGIDRSVIMQHCWDRTDYIKGWFSHAFRVLQMYDWMIHAKGQWVDKSFWKLLLSVGFSTNGWAVQKPIEMLFRGLPCIGSRYNVLVGWAHWRHLVDTIEPSDVPTKRQQRVQIRQCIHMQQCLSLYPLLMHWNVTLNFSCKNPLLCSIETLSDHTSLIQLSTIKALQTRRDRDDI